ncbi:MAG: hypothetical protein KDB73_08625 [Planctomycetes bacterium]|nr:hypothetical protein [Planctomycetota bacterium]
MLRLSEAVVLRYRYTHHDTGSVLHHRAYEQWYSPDLIVPRGAPTPVYFDPSEFKFVKVANGLVDDDGVRCVVAYRVRDPDPLDRKSGQLQLTSRVSGFEAVSLWLEPDPISLDGLAGVASYLAVHEIPVSEVLGSSVERVTLSVRTRRGGEVLVSPASRPVLYTRVESGEVEAIGGRIVQDQLVFPLVAAGSVVSRLSDGSRLSDELSIPVPHGGGTIEVSLPAVTGVLVLAIDGASGEEIAGAQFGLVGPSGHGSLAPLRGHVDGHPLFALGPGNHQVFIGAPGFESQVAAVSVVDGEILQLRYELRAAP